jgi:hypothetical protein
MINTGAELMRKTTLRLLGKQGRAPLLLKNGEEDAAKQPDGGGGSKEEPRIEVVL